LAFAVDQLYDGNPALAMARKMKINLLLSFS
jgi:hypothetical protein